MGADRSSLWIAPLRWCPSLTTKVSNVLVIGVVDCDGERWQKPAEKKTIFSFVTRASGL